MASGALGRTEKKLRIRSNNGLKTAVTREHYLRHDIPCQSQLCDCCQTRPGYVGRLPNNSSHYVLPDITVAKQCMDILEHRDITAVIWLQTVANAVQRHCGQRHYARLQNHIKNVEVHQSALFSNEHHAECWVDRSRQYPSQEQWQHCLIHKAAVYQFLHLGMQMPIVILTLSQQFVDSHADLQDNVFVVPVSQYISSFWSNNESLVQLHKSISDSWMLTDSDPSDMHHALDGKRSTYSDYAQSQVLAAGIKKGHYHVGTLHVNKHFSQQRASVSINASNSSVLSNKIFIDGVTNRNRAIHGDKVIVEILPRNQWTSARNNVLSFHDTSTAVSGGNDAAQDVAMPCGRIVGIQQHNWREYVVYFPQQEGESSSAGNKGKKILVYPYDRRIPKIRIGTRQAESLLGKRVVVRIDSWDKDSQYPNGHFVRSLGTAGELETEVATILVENSINVAAFTSAMESELPVNLPSKPWSLDETEIAQRRDLRKSHLIFSIDPVGCEDVDDALSVRQLSKNKIQLGVHIADVTHFVKPGTHLDNEAKSRATTVYLADRRYDMLPHVLSGDLCSLHSGVDRYAVSVLWDFDTSGKITKIWFGRTVICSKYKLEYEVAQSILDGASDSDIQARVKELAAFSSAEVHERAEKLRWSLRQLTALASSRREIRNANGALELEGLEVGVQLSKDGHSVDDILPKQPLEIHETVAECMIFANEHVARQISKSFPHSALLRRHPKPVKEYFDDLLICAKAKDFQVSTGSNSTLAESLLKCEDPNDPYVNKIMRMLATQAMSEAQYMSTGEAAFGDCQHYGLALEKYTHFTSPIRRYADVLVHRLLMFSLGSTEGPALESTELSQIASDLNRKKRNADTAQKQSTALFQVLFFQSLPASSPHWLTEVIVYQIRQNGCMVYSPRYGIRAPLYMQDKEGLVVQQSGNGGDEPVFGPGSIRSGDTTLTVSGVTSNLRFHLFQHYKVRIELVSSDAHPSQLRFHLASCTPINQSGEAAPSLSTEKMNVVKEVYSNPADTSKPVLAASQSKEPYADSIYEPYRQQEASLYHVIQKLKKLSVKPLPHDQGFQK